MYSFEHAWHEDFFHVVCDALLHGLVGVELVVLCGNDDGVDALGYAFVAILYGDLAFGVWAEIGHYLSFATDVGKGLEQTVCKVETEGHVVFGLVGGVAEHHALVSSALFCAVCAVDASVDVGTLLVYG